MSTLKNLMNLFLFLSYRCKLGEHDVLTMYSMFIVVIYLISVLIITAGRLTFFSLVLLFVILFLLGLMSYLVRNRENNYLISVFRAEELRQELNNKGKMTGEISAKLSILVEETRTEKDSLNLNAWIKNYQAWEKYNQELTHKKYLLKVLPDEVSKMEKNEETLLLNLVKNKF